MKFLGFFLFAFSMVAAAQEPATHPYRTKAIVVLDTTGSMAGPRIEKAQKLAKDFLDAELKRTNREGYQEEPPGLLSFQGEVSLFDEHYWDGEDSGKYVRGKHVSPRSDLKLALDSIRSNLRYVKADKVVIYLFTDGDLPVNSTYYQLQSLLSEKHPVDIDLRLVKVDAPRGTKDSVGELFETQQTDEETVSRENKTDRRTLPEIVKELNYRPNYGGAVEGFFKRSISLLDEKDFKGHEGFAQEIRDQSTQNEFRKKVKELVRHEDRLDKILDNARLQLRYTEDWEKDLDRARSEFITQLEQAKKDISNSSKGMEGMTLSEALAAYGEAISKVRGFHKGSLAGQLERGAEVLSTLLRNENVVKTSRQSVAEAIALLKGIKEDAERFKADFPEEYEKLPTSVKQLLAAKELPDFEELLKEFDTRLEGMADAKESMKVFSKVLSEQTDNLKKNELQKFREAFVAKFGKSEWDKLMAEGAKSGMYYDPKTDEYVLTGIHYSGGGSGGGSSSSSGDSIKMRNEGVIIQLPGRGGGGGTHVSKFTNNGTIIKSGTGINDIRVGSDGKYTVFLNNGNIIEIPAQNIHSKEGVTWIRFEKGFLILKKDASGDIIEAVYVTDEDFMTIATQLESLPSHEEVVAKFVHRDFVCAKEAGRVGGTAIGDTFESMARGGKRLIDEETDPKAGPTWDYNATGEASARLREKCAAETRELEKMLATSSDHLKKFPKEHWSTILTIMMGPDEAQNAIKAVDSGERSAGVASKATHTGVAFAEAAVAYRLALHSHVQRLRGVAPAARPTAPTTRMGFAARVAGNLLRWGTGAALMYDAGQRLYMIWALDVDPTWSPLATGAMNNSAVDSVKAAIGLPKKPKSSGQLKTEEFFKRLDAE